MDDDITVGRHINGSASTVHDKFTKEEIVSKRKKKIILVLHIPKFLVLSANTVNLHMLVQFQQIFKTSEV